MTLPNVCTDLSATTTEDVCAATCTCTAELMGAVCACVCACVRSCVCACVCVLPTEARVHCSIEASVPSGALEPAEHVVSVSFARAIGSAADSAFSGSSAVKMEPDEGEGASHSRKNGEDDVDTHSVAVIGSRKQRAETGDINSLCCKDALMAAGTGRESDVKSAVQSRPPTSAAFSVCATHSNNCASASASSRSARLCTHSEVHESCAQGNVATCSQELGEKVEDDDDVENETDDEKEESGGGREEEQGEQREEEDEDETKVLLEDSDVGTEGTTEFTRGDIELGNLLTAETTPGPEKLMDAKTPSSEYTAAIGSASSTLVATDERLPFRRAPFGKPGEMSSQVKITAEPWQSHRASRDPDGGARVAVVAKQDTWMSEEDDECGRGDGHGADSEEEEAIDEAEERARADEDDDDDDGVRDS